MAEADLPVCDELRRLAGWNQTPNDWRRFLHLSPNGCFIAERGGAPVGTVTTIAYSREIAWVGMLLVHPEARGRGIGRALLVNAIDYLKGERIPCIKLDATPKGEPLYRALGFKAEWSVTRFFGRENFADSSGVFGRQASGKDLPSMAGLDAEAFGCERTGLLGSLLGAATATRVVEDERGIASFGMVRSGADANYLGPVVARSPVAAIQVLGTLVRAVNRLPVYIDVPDSNAAATEWAQRRFQPQRTLLRMFLGDQNRNGSVVNYHALADPSLG